jgi:hypothetical protein
METPDAMLTRDRFHLAKRLEKKQPPRLPGALGARGLPLTLPRLALLCKFVSS